MIISVKNRGLKIICLLAFLGMVMTVIQKGYIMTEAVLGDWFDPKAVETQANGESIPIKYVIAEFVTPIVDHDPNRVDNLQKAVGIVNRCVIGSGEVFSFNKKVGPYTQKEGWKPVTKQYLGNEILENGIADGICQIATGVYNAAFLANFAIIEHHSQRVSRDYVEVGRDTFVYKGKDLVIKNTGDFPVTIESEIVQDQVITRFVSKNEKAKQWQKLFDIDIVINKNGEIPFGQESFYDDALANGVKETLASGVKGYKMVKTVRIIKNEGQIIKEELISRNSYQAVPEKTRIGTDKNKK